MSKRFLTLMSMAAISTALLAAPVSADTSKVKRLQAAPGVTLKQKKGYYVECRYTGLGQECYYVYAKPKGSNKLERIKVGNNKIIKRGDYYVECRYSGLGQDCYYVYMTVKPKKS